MTTEEAKAVGEVAKTASKALDIVQGAGGWLRSVLSTPESLAPIFVHRPERIVTL
jgi:hypothetical protein